MLSDFLDLKDRKILNELDIDCRQKNAQIGKKVGLSKQVVEYRIQRLIKENIITRFSTVIDIYKLGFSKYKIYISLQDANQEKYKQIIDFLKNHSKTEWVASCSGKYDIIAGFTVKDVYEFHQALKEFDELFSSCISARETSISLGVHHWRKEYFIEKDYPRIYQGGNDIVKINKTDEEIIKSIVNNARMPITELAKQLSITPRIAAYRLKKLRKENISLMHRIFFNFGKFNWIFCKAFIRFRNLSKLKYANFIEECDKARNITYAIDCIGPWDLELDFEISDFNSFHKIMQDLRNRFSDIISHYDFVIVINEEKLDYYPGAYPKKR